MVTAPLICRLVCNLATQNQECDSDIEHPDWITTLLNLRPIRDRIYYPACACAARGKVISRGWCPDS